jgi:hypothetical protein
VADVVMVDFSRTYHIDPNAFKEADPYGGRKMGG